MFGRNYVDDDYDFLWYDLTPEEKERVVERDRKHRQIEHEQSVIRQRARIKHPKVLESK